MEAVTPAPDCCPWCFLPIMREGVRPLAARTIGGLLAEADIPYELLFVNDGSRDHTWLAIQKAAEQDPRVRGIRFSRNFGKEAAIFAGLAQARGRAAWCWTVTSSIRQRRFWRCTAFGRMAGRWWRASRSAAAGKIPSTPLPPGPSTAFSAGPPASICPAPLTSSCWTAGRWMCSLPCGRKTPFSVPCPSWIGFDAAQVEFEVQPRAAGSSKWSIRSLTRYAITNLASFSTAPLQLVTFLGVLVFLSSPGAGDPLPVAEAERAGPGGLHHGDPPAAPHRQRADDLSGHHRLLHRQDLWGDQGPAPVHRGRRVRRPPG